jgi:tripartite-type tricarboxylate transporter receptor subunit TctC
MFTHRTILISWLALSCVIAGLGQATAQVYPSRPLTMPVPLAPGGPLDTQARILAERMRAALLRTTAICFSE